MSYRENILHGNSSDIFHQHNLNKEEVKPVRQKRLCNNSFDFLSSPTVDTFPTSKPSRINNSFQSSVFSTQPEQTKISRRYLGKNTLVLGKEDNSDYKVKREKYSSYDPNKYYKNSSAYERKIQQLYGNNSKYTEGNNIKSSIGMLDLEIKQADNANPSGSVKDKTYYMLYHTNGATKKNWLNVNSNKKKAFMNSIDGQFTEGKEAIYNHVESLKSNIFFSPEQEKKNKKYFASKSNAPSEYNYDSSKDYQKKNLRLNQDELIYAKVDWKDPKSYLHFRNRSDIDETAHNRKLNDLFGSKEVKSPKQLFETDYQLRETLESHYHKQNPKELESKVKKQMERISTIPNTNNHHLYDPIKVNKSERLSQNYEVKNFANVKDVNIEQIEKVFRSKGMHIFGTKADNSYYDGKKIGKLTFSIREKTDDKQFKYKFNDAKETIKKETGLDIANASVKSNQKKSMYNIFNLLLLILIELLLFQ